METLPTIRQALATARQKAKTAKQYGAIYHDTILLTDGRTLYINHADAAESSPSNPCSLFGVWVYRVDAGRERPLTL